MDAILTFHLNSDDKKRILELAQEKGLGYSNFCRMIMKEKINLENDKR